MECVGIQGQEQHCRIQRRPMRESAWIDTIWPWKSGSDEVSADFDVALTSKAGGSQSQKRRSMSAVNVGQ
eukprot:2385890-Pleurochrysis_carterae.AAC.2